MLKWGIVSGRADRILIVGTGPSIEHVGQTHVENVDAYVILVNRALKHFDPPRGAWFTLDPSNQNREMLAENEGRRRPGLAYYMAVPTDYGLPNAAIVAHRDPPEAGVTFLHRLTGLGLYKHLPGLSNSLSGVHSGNSAYGALGIAYLMRPKKVALIGVDGYGGYAFDEGLPGKDVLVGLNSMFKTTVRQLTMNGVEVVNGSPQSLITCFPRWAPQDALEWISQP